ncbi:Scavenger receptor class B member 1 [Zootermopsis nevadensis]|uniref:Scavenger receptor class B member 1 n=2 Tax=Zootermopsis nevadensis TaxID=136037 RepID=A0A067RLQ9_ZOONE|nr:Scavenger receptor class B member 1 [Zootermopsis nevadensis]
MRKGFPAFEWWADPPQEVLVRMYVFNVTNYDEFMNGSQTKIHLQEVGPYIFREKIEHKDIRLNENGTLTYTTKRRAVFEPDLNTLSLNASLNVPNLALLGMTSYLSGASFFVKFAFNLVVRKMDMQPLVKISVYDYLWNNSNSLLTFASKMVPNMIPVDNLGVLHMIYRTYEDEVTVFIGPNNTKRFFTMDMYNGKNRFGYWSNMTCDSVKLATEGVLYHQEVSKEDKLHFFRKNLCRVTPLYFANETVNLGMSTYRYVLPLDTFHRPKDGSHDCYTLPGDKPHPDGLSEISPCFYDFPMVASLPHFLAVDPAVRNQVDGMQPDEEKHSGYVTIEPNTGLPLESKAGMQCNLVVKNVDGYSPVKSFSNTYIPIFWLQLHQVGIPQYLVSMMYFVVVVLPNVQGVVSALLVVLGTSLLAIGVFRFQRKATKAVYSYISLDTVPSSI